jgi:hypothetical protein
MTKTFYALDNEFAASSGSNVNVHNDYSYFDHPPGSTSNLEVTSNMGDDKPILFEVGETYDLTWSGHGGGDMQDATIIRSDYVGPGEGAVVFEGVNSNTGELFQLVWSPGFDLETWYWDNNGGPSSPNAFWTSDQNNAETYQAVCFAEGTFITTPNGPRPVEDLKPNDLVLTLDHGAMPIRWVRSDLQPLEVTPPDAKPVLIATNALGDGRPLCDLIVSPQHRIFVGGNGQLQNLFAEEVFVPAKALTKLPGVRHMNGKQSVTWVHFACDAHEIVLANDCWSETLLLGTIALALLTDQQRAELHRIFGPPVIADGPLNGPPARDCYTVGMVQRRLETIRRTLGTLQNDQIERHDMIRALANPTPQRRKKDRRGPAQQWPLAKERRSAADRRQIAPRSELQVNGLPVF